MFGRVTAVEKVSQGTSTTMWEVKGNQGDAVMYIGPILWLYMC